MSFCNVLGCSRGAVVQPVLLLWAPKSFGSSDPIRVNIGIGLCSEHQKTFTRSSPGVADMEELAVRLAIRAGKVKPDLARTRIDFLAFQ